MPGCTYAIPDTPHSQEWVGVCRTACSFTTAECRSMPGTHLSPLPCLTEGDKLVPEPRQTEACLFLLSSAGGDVWDGLTAW